jgi:hypothetical protein
MPIDLASVNWIYVGVLAVFVFVSTFIGNLLSLNHRGTAAFLSALAFVVIFVFWSYYPHANLPLPTTFSGQRTPVSMAEPAPAVAHPAMAAPTAPANPVTDVTPPKNPVTDVTPPANKPQ